MLVRLVHRQETGDILSVCSVVAVRHASDSSVYVPGGRTFTSISRFAPPLFTFA